MHSCTQCFSPFDVSQGDLDFYDSISPKFAGKKYPIPPPTFCPDCRQKRRLTWRNERTMYGRVCPKTQKKFISPFAPDKPLTVYENDYWYGDSWDARDYGREFDFSRPFFEQFQELMNVVPQLGRSCAFLQNCEYVNQCGWSKDCYLIFEADYCEQCSYSNNINHCKSSMDLFQCMRCELCYQCIDCQNCYGLKYCTKSETCSDSWFLKSCIGCKSCVGCVNLRNAQYCIFNEQYDHKTYEAKLQSLGLHLRKNQESFAKDFAEFALRFPCKAFTGAQNENSVGDGLWQTQRCTDCFDLSECQDCRFVYQVRNMKNVYDVMNFGADAGAEFSYECHELGDGVRSVLFCDQIWTGSHDLLYCKLCLNGTRDCFGCVGLKHASYCILNKQYTKEEYEAIVPKIIEHMRGTREWGEFFPASVSPFCYNETIAEQYYPLGKEKALAQGFTWKDDIEQPITFHNIIDGDQLPDDIASVDDNLLEWAIRCPVTGRFFKIIRQELEWYRQQNLPLPQFHHDERHRLRMAQRNPRTLWDRTCGKCQEPIRTSYAPDRPEIVFCEQCYLKEVY